MPESTAFGEGPRRLALVTGASTGIGKAFAERLAAEAYDLLLVARSTDRLEALARQLGDSRQVQADVLRADLTNPGDLHSVEERIAKDRPLDLLVNNAGFGTVGRFAELDPEREEEEIRLNVIALMRLTRAALPRMVERGRGAIINVSSMAGLAPTPYYATYGGTKAFVCSFTESLHDELRGTGVRVQALCPGFTRTEFQERAGVDASRIPSFAWQEASEVVEISLAALGKGTVVCVPGAANRALAGVTTLLPRRWASRVAAAIGKRALD
jgi:short-subunit dehydrogenase